MQQEVPDRPDNIVIQELQKGYMIHDRLLRPAMVVVSKADNKSVHKGA
jgi:molecular chaperone GrpE